MNEQEMRQKIRGELLAEREMGEAQVKMKRKDEIKKSFAEFVEKTIKPQLEKMIFVIVLNEAITEEKVFDDILEYLKNTYEKTNGQLK